MGSKRLEIINIRRKSQKGGECDLKQDGEAISAWISAKKICLRLQNARVLRTNPIQRYKQEWELKKFQQAIKLAQTEIYFIIKMNAVIKLSNTQYLQVLQELLHSKIQIKQDKISLVKLPFYNFIAFLVSIFTSYTKQTTEEPLHLFILSFIQSQSQSAFEFYRQAQGLISMWKKYVQCHEQARLFLSVLQPQRSGKEGVKLFLKIRKAILRNIGPKILQEIQLNHQDIIALTHTIFTAEMKAFTGKKLHQLLFNLKKKSLSSGNKINGAVICQFLLNCSQKFQRQELANIKTYYQHSPQEANEFMRRRVFKPLQEKVQNHVYEAYDDPQHGLSHPQEQEPIEQTPKFRLETINPKKNNFIANNLEKTKGENSVSPDKRVLHAKYSYSWQKFLQTNKEIKEKLLKPYKNDQY